MKSQEIQWLRINRKDRLPADSQSAIAELNRLRQAGAHFIAFAWPAFWWLEYYTEFSVFLRSTFPCVLQNERLMVFNIH